MATIRIKTTVRNSMAQQIVNAIDAGAGPGKLKFFTGSLPATGDAGLGGATLLGTLTCSDPSATVASGAITFSSITQDASADATGTAGFAELTDSDDNHVAYLDVSNEAGTGAIKLNTTSIVSGGPIQVSSMTITVGGA